MTFKNHQYLPVTIWMILIFAVSSIPDLPSNKIDVFDFLLKKTAHFMEYAILFLLWYRVLDEKNPFKAILYSVIYAFTDEIHQLFVPGRTGHLRDVAIDISGILIFAYLVLKFNLWKKHISPLPIKRLGK